MDLPCVSATDVSYRYPATSRARAQAPEDASSTATIKLPNLDIAKGEHTLLIGPSGSGKSTLLNIVAGLITPATGKILIDGVLTTGLTSRARDHLRGQKIGLVMQRLHLIGALSVMDNLRMAQQIATGQSDDRQLMLLLGELNIADKAKRFPRALSQGEAQRVAIARALVNRPALLIADEPTSALDDSNTDTAISLLLDQAHKHGATLLVATHDHRIKPSFKHTVALGATAASTEATP
jgi:putative ABC transport system ATP-binding protein